MPKVKTFQRKQFKVWNFDIIQDIDETNRLTKNFFKQVIRYFETIQNFANYVISELISELIHKLYRLAKFLNFPKQGLRLLNNKIFQINSTVESFREKFQVFLSK